MKKKIIKMIRRWEKESRLERRMEKENPKNDMPLEERVKTTKAYGKSKPSE